MQKIKQKVSYRLIICIAICIMVLFAAMNQNEVKAASKYYIQVNRSTNVVTVFKKKVNGVYKEPVKAFICSAGGTNTPLGTFNTKAKYRWHALYGGVFGQYATRIEGSILFHSVWYYENGKNNTISVAQYNKLGLTASAGCIRMTVAGVKWIYDNCPVGTEVKIIAGTSKDDPLGKPEALKLSTSKLMDWCPTDPDLRNPYKNNKPSIKGAKSQTVQLGVEFNPLKGVTATDTAGSDATSKITVSGKVNTKKAGKYKITYKVTDAKGKSAKKTVTITVKDKTRVVISAKSKTVQLGAKFSPLKGVTAKTKAGTNRTSTLTYSGKVNTKKAGKYKITYRAKDVLGRSTKKVVTITVKDKTRVVISAKSKTIQLGTKFSPLKGVTAKTKAGTNRTSTLAYSGKVNTKKLGTYKVTYKAKDVLGRSVKKTVTIKVTDTTTVVISAKNQTIQLGTSFNPLKGVTAKTKAGTNRTSTLAYSGKVNINKIGTYTITYTAKKLNGSKVKKSIKVTVGDYKKPTISGVKNKTIYISDFANGETLNLLEGITAKATNGKNLTGKISVSGNVDVTKVGTYKVTYSVTNDSNIKTTKTATYTVKEPVEIKFEDETRQFVFEGKENATEEETIAFIKTEVLKKVTGYIRGKVQEDDAFTLTVTNKSGSYLVTITLQDSTGYQKQEACTVTLR